ncbi:MAG: winged helix-turn-helix domain-containing protein [Acidobacteriota bacterium]|nr:winged helix-turn-helix domain-containing protein [Acidobacteriota bacterium]
MNDNAHNFEGFELDAERKILRRGGEIVPLPPKAVELLVVLIKSRGEVVSKNELLETVWQGTFVEESVLSNNIYILRKTLSELGVGKNLIQTVPRRGYRFNAKPTGESEMILEHHVFEQTVIEEISETKAEAIENYAETAILPAPQTAIERTNRKGAPHQYLLAACFILVLLLASGFAVWQFASTKAEAGLEKINSIAVLPLKPLTAGESNKVLSLGLADALIANLGNSQKIVVRPISSITKYADSEYDALAVGRSLQTDAVLEGSFQRADNRIRVRVKLLRVSDGKQIWAGTFDETEGDVFKLQDEISSEAAAALTLNLNERERQLAFKRYTDNVAAYQAYQTGVYLFHRREYDQAIEQFEIALKHDPNYALAYAGMADVLARKANNSENKTRTELYEKAKTYALKAIALDGNLAEAHAAIGWINRIYDWNWTESEKNLKRAIELAPNVARHHRLYAYLLITLGRTAEAVEFSREAKRLDPITESDAWALYCDGKYEESAAEYARQMQILDTSDNRRGLALAYLELGKYVEAIELIEKAPPVQQEDFSVRVILAIAYFRQGKIEKADKLLKELKEKGEKTDGRQVRLANIYAVMGQKENALRELQKGFEKRDDRLMWIKTNSFLSDLRGDARFQEILRQMNL